MRLLRAAAGAAAAVAAVTVSARPAADLASEMPSIELLEYLGGLVADERGDWTGPEDLEAGGLEALVLPVVADPGETRDRRPADPHATPGRTTDTGTWGGDDGR